MFYDGKIIDVSTNYEEYTRHGKELLYMDSIQDVGF